MTPASLELLDKLIEPEWKIFEYGSGVSTEWYAKRAAHVTSVEDNANWYHKVMARLSTAKVSNVDLIYVDGPYDGFLSAITTFPDEYFDLVIIDGLDRAPGDRLKCLEFSKFKVKPGKIIVLDDSDLRKYRRANDILSAWQCQRLLGVKTYPLMTVETTVFTRPITA